MLLLVCTALAAWLTGDPLDAAAIGVVLLINVALGFVTELRARRALHALLKFDVPRARALRDGEVREIDAVQLVPGDVIDLEAGQSVPADARLLTAVELRIGEAALTGESLPVDKHAADALDADTPLAERANMLYKGTTALAGSGRAVVTATGEATEIGHIGGLVAGIRDEKTPLERRLDTLGVRLIFVALAVAAAVALLGVLRGEDWGVMIETGLALAIAAVPEGLPAIITIALAVGVRRMARRNALTRRLPAVEALGAATVICADKTGTLTAGEMTVTTLSTGAGTFDITGAGYNPHGEFLRDGSPIDIDVEEHLRLALQTGVLANAASLVDAEDGWTVAGDPTDGALLVAGRKAGIVRQDLLNEEPVRGVLPFSSERQLAASFHDADDGIVAHVKGAPSRVLEHCSRVLTAEGDVPLDDTSAKEWTDRNDAWAARGLRVLALARGRVSRPSEESLHDLTFMGLVGMMDPPAPGVLETIRRFRRAGIRTVMITGDQRLTAQAVGHELGVLAEREELLDGQDLRKMQPAELAERIATVGAFSRTTPEDKLRLIEAYRQRNEIVAMLGDGVNDAAALRKADVGVAMGGRGTDVAREAADVVLQDDRFPTIGAAIEEGRVIYDNIRKFVFYLFSCNIAEIFVLLCATIVGMPLPLLPLQILWLNIVTDTFPALSLALEPAEPDVMDRPPRDPQESLMSAPFVRSIALYGALITAATMAMYAGALALEVPVERARTIAFLTLAFAQLFHLGNARSRSAVAGTNRMFSNRWALAAVGLVIVLQLCSVYVPALAAVLDLVPPTGREWLVLGVVSVVPAVVGQVLRRISARRP